MFVLRNQSAHNVSHTHNPNKFTSSIHVRRHDWNMPKVSVYHYLLYVIQRTCTSAGKERFHYDYGYHLNSKLYWDDIITRKLRMPFTSMQSWIEMSADTVLTEGVIMSWTKVVSLHRPDIFFRKSLSVTIPTTLFPILADPPVEEFTLILLLVLLTLLCL